VFISGFNVLYKPLPMTTEQLTTEIAGKVLFCAFPFLFMTKTTFQAIQPNIPGHYGGEIYFDFISYLEVLILKS